MSYPYWASGKTSTSIKAPEAASNKKKRGFLEGAFAEARAGRTVSSNKLLREHVASRVEFMNRAGKRNHFGLEILRRGRDPMNTVHEDRRAEAPVIDRLLHRRISWIEAAHEADLDQPFSGLRLGVHEDAALHARQRKRLFAKDRLSDANTFRDEIEMRVIGGCDQNGVDVDVADDLKRVCLDAFDIEGRRGFARPFSVNISDGHKRAVPDICRKMRAC